MTDCRFNLAAIEAALRDVQRGFAPINGSLPARHDDLDHEVVECMVAGYAYVADLIRRQIDLFALGSSRYLLELNRVVLAGPVGAGRGRLAGHFAATEERFYNQSGIGDLMRWYGLHRALSVWERAAGAYIRILSAPQLYLEGNHRCGALIISYLLVRECQPPFVLTTDNAQEFFAPSSQIKTLHKNDLAWFFTERQLRQRFAGYLRTNVCELFLIPFT